MRKVITIVLGVVVLGAGIFIARTLASTEQKQRPQIDRPALTVFTKIIKNGTVPVEVIESGRLIAKNRIELYAEVQGVMEPTGKEFKPGSVYSKGQTVVHIRSADFEANIRSQKSTLQNLITSILPDLRLDFPEAYPNWDKYLREFDINGQVARLPDPTSDQEKFFVTGKNIYTTYYTTKNMELVLDKYNLRAPFNGILTEALVTPGSLVRQGQRLGEFIDPSVYELEVSVSKSVLASLSIGENVIVRDSESLLKNWKGRIIRINGKVDPTTQTVKVFIEVRGVELKEGMFLEAVMNGNPVENAYEVDRGLLIDDSNLYIVRDSSLVLISIEPLYYSTKTVIVGGLKDGDELLSKPVPGAYDGMEVSVYESVESGE